MTIDMTFEKREELFRKEEHDIGHEEGFIEGHAKGLTEGHAKGLTEGHSLGLTESIKNIMKNMNFTEDQAMQALGIHEEDRAKYSELLKNLK